MFSSSSYLHDINDIPSEWILENYLDLPYKLTGQSVKLKSIFNIADKDPSMVIYYNSAKKKYVFKDFSSDSSFMSNPDRFVRKSKKIIRNIQN